jgi:hypothetical protein
MVFLCFLRALGLLCRGCPKRQPEWKEAMVPGYPGGYWAPAGAGGEGEVVATPRPVSVWMWSKVCILPQSRGRQG